MAMERELLRHLGKKPATMLYPFEKFKPIEGSRAKIEIDISKCIGCRLCIFDCPAFSLEMVGKGLTCDMKWYPGRCVYCGQCVEVCPKKAIKQTDEFDLATQDKEELVYKFKRSKTE